MKGEQSWVAAPAQTAYASSRHEAPFSKSNIRWGKNVLASLILADDSLSTAKPRTKALVPYILLRSILLLTNANSSPFCHIWPEGFLMGVVGGWCRLSCLAPARMKENQAVYMTASVACGWAGVVRQVK